MNAVNGSSYKGSKLMYTHERLSVTPHSRSRVSDDNAFTETLLRTLKYRPGYSANGFADVPAARTSVLDFVAWYNMELRHSGLPFVTPEQRHSGPVCQAQQGG
jgi:putative transposase